MTDKVPQNEQQTEQQEDQLVSEGSLEERFPEHLRTYYTETDLWCPRCHSTWQPAVASFVNAKTHPQAREGILRKTMHRSWCVACKRHEHEIDHIFDYYDPDRNLIVQVRPWWEFKAGGGEEAYWDRLERVVIKYAEMGTDVQVDVVFGFDEMIEKYLGGEEAVEQAKVRREREIAEKLEPGSVISDDDNTTESQDKA